VAHPRRHAARSGAKLDSFSDFVAFGLAPAFVLIGAPSSDGGPAWLLGERALAVVYVYGLRLRAAAGPLQRPRRPGGER
jgi:phosphatidylserine synthase